MSPSRWPMPLPAQPRCTSSTWPTFMREVEAVARLLERVLDALELVGDVVVGGADVEPVVLLDGCEVRLVDRRALDDLLRAAVGQLAHQQLLDAVEGVGLDDAQLVVQ